MKPLVAIFFIVASTFAYATSEPATDKAAAKQAALSWLALVDQGEYEASWQHTGDVFKQQITPQNWVKALNATRAPLGHLTSRELVVSKATKELPGVPDGNYIVLQFQSSFGNKNRAIETLTLQKNAQHWQPVGYFIK
ncbi:DUF4019 domain-containing protein [Thalassotalea euphylliae]|uniref:DUF4019 domain-containing protein n=1 Tax=Thalassotalea euphylliae TaxID=1655234 RepID=UPI003630FBAF